MAIILGIDPGTRVTGFGVISFDQRNLTVLDYGCIRPPQKEPMEKRYLAIFQGVNQLIQQYSPVALSVETQFVKKNVMSAMKLGMARAAVMIAAAALDVPVFEYSPTRVKQAVGVGSATKETVKIMVSQLLNLAEPPTPEDAADALAIAICHAYQSERNHVSYI